MTDEATRARQRAERVTALTHMLRAFGQEATSERLEALGLATNLIPQHVFAAAVHRAIAETTGGWPPGPGDIMSAAVALEPGERSEVSGTSLPRWYRRALGERTRDEKPRELGQRTGGHPLDIDRITKAAGGES